MKKSFTAKTKLFITILLVLTMAFSLVTSVACKKGGNGGTTNTTTTTTPTIVERTDSQLLKNGDFEYGTANTKLTEYPVYSSINWTKANDSQNGSNAVSSSYASGIVDTREYKYEYDDQGYVKLDENGKPVYALDEDENKIEAYQSILKNKDSQFDKFKIYEYEYEEDGVTVKVDDLGNPIKAKDENGNLIYSFYNPHSPSYYGLTEYEKEEGLTGGGKVLMINNHSTEDKGAAQYFNSSSDITLNPNENGVFEVWVLTKDLSTKLDNLDEVGAYIQITTTIGSITTPATRIKNVNTNGEWVKFTVYVKGNSFAQTKIGIRLGLGFGSKNIYQDYVEGYAFFDDASFKVLGKDETLPTSYDLGNVEMFSGSLEDSKLVVNGQKDYLDYLYSSYTTPIVANPKDATDNIDYKYLCVDNFAIAPFTNITLGIDCYKAETVFDISGGTTQNFTELDNYINFANLKTEDQAKFDTTAVPSVSSGVLTFSSDKYYNATYTTPDFDVDGVAANSDPTSDNYLKISFWVKTDLQSSNSGLTILLLDKGTGSDYAEVKVKINGSDSGNYTTTKNINKDHDDFVKVTIIVSNTYRLNDADEVLARKFALKFVLGPTAPVNANNIYAFPKGDVWVKDFTLTKLAKAEVDSVEKTNDTSVTERMLQADKANVTTETTSNDNYTFTYGGMVDNIEQNVVSGILNYTGVPGNHIRVQGGADIAGQDKVTEYTQANTVSGIFNTEFMANYKDADFNGLKSDISTWAQSVPTNNTYLQPLMINNQVDGLSYGYIGDSTSIAVNATCVISVKVKIFGEATAYIYLTNADDKKEFKVLSVNAKNTDLSQDINQDYCIKVTKDMVNDITGGVGYAEIKFIIKTGSEKAINYKLELWNGPRTFANGTNDNKTGIVLFDSYTYSTSENYEEALLKLESFYDAELDNVGTTYSYASADSNKQIFTRLPSKVLTDENPDGETRTYTVDDKDNTKTAFMTNGLFIISDLTSIDAPTEIDERTPEDSSSDDDTSGDTTTDDNGANIWLLISSAIVALALIVALVAIGVKKILEVVNKKKASKHSYYDRDARDKALDSISKKKEKETKFKEEYDYENIESNIIEDEEEVEEVTEEPTEEVEETETDDTDPSDETPSEE